MKLLFCTLLLVLVLASVGIRWSFPDVQTDRPVIYWVTEKNPARELQVETFHAWLIKNGHVDDSGDPIVELRLDVANMGRTKQLIQSVSGVAADLMDTYDASIRLFDAMDVLVDLTEDAKAMGFDPSQTYPAIEPSITIDGRQVRYPANVDAAMMWVNVDALRRFGFEPPVSPWTWEEFEALGLAFRDAANPPGTQPNERRFLASDIPAERLYRTTGLSVFNETLTACVLNDPKYIKTLETKKRWVYDINIMPTPDDRAAFVSQQGFGGANPQLFANGNYVMVEGGRWLLIQFRHFGQLGGLKVVEFPHDGFRCTTIQARGVVVYAGSRHPELAKLFLAYLASDDYNSLIVADADALPPNPRFTRTEAFLRPPDYPNEWQAHGAFVEAAETIAVGFVTSPYVLPTVVNRERRYYEELFMNGKLTAAEAARLTVIRIDEKIASELSRKPELAEAYAADVAIQHEIDALKAAGRSIPAGLIKNPFHLAYYRRTGRLSGAAATPGAAVEGGAAAVSLP